MEYRIKEEVINAVLSYLGTRPFVEVFKLIDELKRVEEIKKD